MSKRDERLSVDELARIVASRLVSEGFKVHRYDAVTTNSVYLKPDYGACGSIRISDHPGYKHLSYRWNIGSHIEDVSHALAESYPRSFFPADKWEQLVDQANDECDPECAWLVERQKGNYAVCAMAILASSCTEPMGFCPTNVVERGA